MRGLRRKRLWNKSFVKFNQIKVLSSLFRVKKDVYGQSEMGAKVEPAPQCHWWTWSVKIVQNVKWLWTIGGLRGIAIGPCGLRMPVPKWNTQKKKKNKQKTATKQPRSNTPVAINKFMKRRKKAFGFMWMCSRSCAIIIHSPDMVSVCLLPKTRAKCFSKIVHRLHALRTSQRFAIFPAVIMILLHAISMLYLTAVKIV